MIEKLSELRCKEVINVCDGYRMGFICDMEIDINNGRIISIIIPGKGKIFGCLFRNDDYFVPWECITKIGEDLILVEINPERARTPRERKKWKF